ncbi:MULTISPECIES: translation initiation factor [Pseudidiomarina]|uniref:Translation initiation factor 1 (eIF-1/SUI1) n=4 Tax=Pseudidiomarina TaxID=2800384 RepID=A0A368UQ57_9GAMM|nr:MULTISPECIES: stress response translation initiation inhibitor YciH [Pseudidiomarina]MDT7524553.1 stress response translation initiation inhibitor YciH [Pseudidiomarina sp. GXY010]MDX1526451.1 stress response translation initiation inhibitor YciH [Pseudidiomarina maritima]PWW11886.1 translation initiation factor 1 (eIF-1/SUI1) [Pseudidiomarina maritima]RBP88953.1 translation initiation factor 1 (eIF-1/SUI1) [Pseudidiomarina tainanensis]RCW30939.1 translation initiation factor 1 (eIF-1/SUI1)
MSSLQDQLQGLGFKLTDTAAESNPEADETSVQPSDYPLRLQRQTKGRKGKGVTVILDLPKQPELLANMASALRKHCGVGGAVKQDTIELQGDQRERAKQWLEQQGYKVKFAGG